MLIQMKGRPWCLNWRSWVTWDTTRTLSIYWEPALTEVSQRPKSHTVKIYTQCVCMKKHFILLSIKEPQHISSSGPVLVITEYCSLGDLLNFLRQRAETFVNFVMNIPEYSFLMDNSSDYKNICNQKCFIRRYSTTKEERFVTRCSFSSLLTLHSF